jgi:hypothetical protein
MTQEEINRKLDEASIGKIVLYDDRGGSGVWVCNLHFSHKPPPNGYYGEGATPFEAIEDAAKKIGARTHVRL